MDVHTFDIDNPDPTPGHDVDTVVRCGGTSVVLGDDTRDNWTDIAKRFEASAAEHEAIAAWAWEQC